MQIEVERFRQSNNVHIPAFVSRSHRVASGFPHDARFNTDGRRKARRQRLPRGTWDLGQLAVPKNRMVWIGRCPMNVRPIPVSLTWVWHLRWTPMQLPFPVLKLVVRHPSHDGKNFLVIVGPPTVTIFEVSTFPEQHWQSVFVLPRHGMLVDVIKAPACLTQQLLVVYPSAAHFGPFKWSPGS